MDPFPQMTPTRHVALLTGSSSLTPGAVLPFPIGILQWFSVDQQRILGVKLMTVSTKLSPLKVWGPFNTAMILHIDWKSLTTGPFGYRWTKALMLADMTGGAGDSPQLESRIEVGILFVIHFALSSCLSNKWHLLAQGGMTVHAEISLLLSTLGEVDDLPPGAWPHGHAV
jgi:hypothetical protein